jgi:NitT/TauT family transport system substrate-binding protein
MTPFVIFVDRNSNIRSLQDRKGKTIANSPNSAGSFLLPAALNKVGLSLNDVQVVNTTPDTLNSLYFTGKTDALINDVAVNAPLVEPMRPSRYLYLSDILQIPNIGIFAREDYLRSNPEIARKFLRALSRGLEALNDANAVREVSEYVERNNVGVKSDLLVESWRLYAPFTKSDQQRGQPTGWMPPVMWQETIETLHRYGGLSGDLVAENYYTNNFLAK